MTEYCTCGTTLVEDARFCHRCGRPTSEFTGESPIAETPPPLPIQQTLSPKAALQAKLAQLPVSFSNPIALRVAFLMSLAVIPVELAPVLNALFFVWWLAAGWCAVLLYRKLTGSPLSIRAGARLGSITGVLTFVSLAIGLSVSVLLTGKQFFDDLEQTVVKQNPDASQMIHDPAMMFALLLLVLAVIAALAVGLCAAGGALGARFTARKVSS